MESEMESASDVPVKATRVSFDVVETLQKLDGAGVTEVADHLDLPQSTVHDHLRTLEELELVINEDGTYRTGTRFLNFGGYARQRMRVFDVAKPKLKSLAAETGEHTNLMIEEHGKGVFLYRVEGENAVKLDTYDGYRVHLQTTALGKAMMAHMPREKVTAILDKHGMPAVTDRTVTDRDVLFEEFEEIRDQGYALDIEERVQGMRCVAAPILANGEVLGAISVSGPKNRLEGERFEQEIPDQIMRAANVIEVNLTYA